MTGPSATLRRGMSFIFDPVPRVDRKPKLRVHLIELAIRVNPIEAVDWTGLDPEVLEARHPRSSPARLRPYDWMIEHAWPVDGWVIS